MEHEPRAFVVAEDGCATQKPGHPYVLKKAEELPREELNREALRQAIIRIRDEYITPSARPASDFDRRRITKLLIEEFLRAGGGVTEAFFFARDMYDSLKGVKLACAPIPEEELFTDPSEALRLVCEVHMKHYPPEIRFPATPKTIKVLTGECVVRDGRLVTACAPAEDKDISSKETDNGEKAGEHRDRAGTDQVAEGQQERHLRLAHKRPALHEGGQCDMLLRGRAR